MVCQVRCPLPWVVIWILPFGDGPPTVTSRVRIVISRLVFYFCSPSGFSWLGSCGQVYVFPCCSSMGFEASPLASESLRKLRSSIRRVVWSRRHCWMGLLVVTLLFAWFGFGFVCFVGILLFGLRRLVGFIVCLEMVSEGSPGHGPIHLLSASAAEIGFRWDPLTLAWSRPGLPLLSNLAFPVQHFKAAILDDWRNKVSAGLCGRRVWALVGCSWLLAAP